MASFGFGFGDSFFGSNPAAIVPFTPAQTPAPAPSPSSSGGSIWDTIFKFAQLGTSTYLAQDALNQSRPATITYNAAGQPVVTGGGAALALNNATSSLSQIPGIVWVGIVVLLIFTFLHTR
jgi:hypothetical protein